MSTASHLSSASAAAAASLRPQSSQTERTADAREAFLTSLAHASREIDADLQSRGKLIHENATALKKQDKDVQNETKKLAKENENVERWAVKSGKKIDELSGFGDIQGLEGLEDDLGDIEAMLDMLEGKDGQKDTLPTVDTQR
ncbi:hypothetical protein H2198_004531 [Neophaeococcomyces mojaviensis]|uniref:Uncharacterized protein n=1 Tax=Neophaeococcomyces mojaviensis TaxID=3383035 RepID=A0ACC3A8X5_9EURO|nr:hypothetical protein H2198_004531 [Knufia sp. JES_112]